MSDERWLLELQPSHPTFLSIIHIILEQGEQAETHVSTYHWPECSPMATPSSVGTKEINSLFQGAIGLRKKRIDIEGLAASCRGIMQEVAFEMSPVGRVGFLQLE